MKLSELKTILPTLATVEFQLENGSRVPEHFHITEVGLVHKNFIDCGGTVCKEVTVTFQLWNANDFEHRLKPSKLLNIIHLSEKKLNIGDFEIEVEYQQDTIGKYGLAFNGENFILTNKKTNCLAPDHCGVPPKKKLSLSELKSATTACCAPNTGCC